MLRFRVSLSQLPSRVLPVCAPSLSEKLTTLADLSQVPIIRDTQSMFEWDMWFNPNDMSENQLGNGPEFSKAALCLDAAIAGQGVFFAWETLAQDALAVGRLVVPFPGRFKTRISYWFAEPDDRRRTPQVEAFRHWLVDELGEEVRSVLE
ncbi:MAG: LysR substrate-binding domain-containing protein [Sulfitobacter sp.]